MKLEKYGWVFYVLTAIVIISGLIWFLIYRNNQSIKKEKSSIECVIKGNINKDGEKIYHVPGQRYYSVTQINTDMGERWFCSESEAKDSGWRKSKQ